jgi:hypothetical protein
MGQARISARLSGEAKAALEAYVKQHGIKKGRVIEEGLPHHLQALREIPEDIVVPARLALSERSMQEVAGCLSADEESSGELRVLFQNADES